MSDRYQKIIAKLEAKIKPMHDEVKELRDKLEISSLDRQVAEETVLALEDELAQTRAAVGSLQAELDASHHDKQYLEQLSEKNLQLGLQVTSLEQQVADLQELQRLNDQLEESHVSTERELQAQINALETAVRMTRSRLKAAERRTEELTAALGQSTPRASVEPEQQRDDQALEAARLALEHAKIDLRATKLDLNAVKQGLYPLLHEITDSKHMFLLELWAGMDPQINISVQALFDKFKTGDISKERLLKETATITEPDGEIPLPAAQVYFSRYGQNAVEMAQLSQAQIRAAIADPSSLPEQTSEKTEAPEPLPSLPIPPESSETAKEDAEPHELEALRVRLQIIEAKAEKARELAAKVTELEGHAQTASSRAGELEAALEQERTAIAERDSEIARIKEAEVPANLDTATFTQLVRSLRSTVGYLSKSPPSFDLAPLETRATSLLPLARSARARRYMAAIDEFYAVPIGKGWRPRNKIPAAVAGHQAGTLAMLSIEPSMVLDS